MHQFDTPARASVPGRPSATTDGVLTGVGELVTLAEAAAYAGVDPRVLLLAVTRSRLVPVVVNPIDGAGTLLARAELAAGWPGRRD